MTTQQTVEELEAALKAAKQAKADEAAALRATVTPVYAYTVEVDEREARFSPIYDDEVLVYRLVGTCTNKEACLAVGHTDSGSFTGTFFEGSMAYYFNKATGRIICSTGGGHVFISDRESGKTSPIVRETFKRLSAFIVENPEGGDVTTIIQRHKDAVSDSH